MDENDGSADYRRAGRYFRATCPHGLWVGLVTGTTGPTIEVTTPCCGVLELETTEP